MTVTKRLPVSVLDLLGEAHVTSFGSATHGEGVRFGRGVVLSPAAQPHPSKTVQAPPFIHHASQSREGETGCWFSRLCG